MQPGLPITEPALAARPPLRRRVGGYLGAFGLVVLANLIAGVAGAALPAGDLVMVFLLAVLAAGAGLGLGPALLAALLAGFTYNFFELAPLFSFRIARPADALTFAMFFVAALATGWFSGRVRDQARNLAAQAQALSVMLDASRALSAASTNGEAAQALAAQIGAATGGGAVVLLPGEGGLTVAGAPPGLEALAPAGIETAERVWTTPSAPEASDGWDFQRLDGLHGRVGVIGLRQPRARGEDQDLLRALLRQGAVALERGALATAAAENQALRDADRLRSALLSSISHDFRTPLSTVLGAATTLLDYEAGLTPAVRRDLLHSIQEDAERLNRYVGDLLDMARLEGGALRPRQDWIDVREVIASALNGVRDRLGGRKVTREFAEQVSLVRADATLLEQAFVNLIENAVAHTPENLGVEVAVFEDARNVVIAVEDQGPGIPPEALDQVFEKFRRANAVTDRTGGLGLGLSITKGFVEAMGGEAVAVSPVSAGKGSRFLISLPKAMETPKDLL